jgi:amino acid adenylation domain-containing protein
MSDDFAGLVTPFEPTCLHRVLCEHAERSPHAVVVLAPGRAPLYYGRLRRHVEEVTTQLRAMGIGRRVRVAMVLPEGPELAVAFLAVSSIATCAPLNPAYRAPEFDSHFADLNPGVLLVQSGVTSPAIAVARARGIPVLELAPDLEAEAGVFALSGKKGFPKSQPGLAQPRLAQPDWAQPDDIALVLHTSGTAARPKLVPLSHLNLCASACNIGAALELTGRDRCLNVMPLFHIHGLSTLLASLAAGASIVCPPGFLAPEFFRWLAEFRPTWYSAAPTIHQSILENASLHARLVQGSSLRFLRSASAPMSRPLLIEMERVFRVPFIEAYGMTEASPQIASNRLPPHARKPGSVGRAAGPEVAIIDEAGQLVPHGQTGEIVIRGANVMSAYENNAAANESAFVDGWFRTGDLGHLDEQGDLFITGRAKEIINRGGEKISPHEVDGVLLAHPAVMQAATFAVPHPTLGEGIAAAVVLQESATEAEIRRFVAERLAHFKVPQQFVFVDEIPTGATGKIQRIGLAQSFGLREQGLEQGDLKPDFAAPRTPVEAKLAKAFAGALGTARVGIHDNFFQLGGDSLMAAQVIARLQRELGIELPLELIFERPTVAEVAEFVGEYEEYCGEANTWGKEPVQAIARRSANEPCPLSFAQQRVWFLDQIEPGNPAYNMHAAHRLQGKLNLTILEQSLGALLARHQALRTSFLIEGGQPVQVVAPERPVRMPVMDISHLPAREWENEASRLASEEAGHPFHLARGPLFRPLLLRLDSEEHVLLLTIHHIVCDGWSLGVLFRELGTLYQAFLEGRDNPLPPLPLDYTDYAIWQRHHLQGEVLQRQLAYWKEQLKDSTPLLALPTDRPRPSLQSSRGARIETAIPGAVVSALKELGKGDSATLFMTMLAAFQTLLARYCGQDDIAVGAPIASRNRAELEGLIGFFANTLVMRTDLSGNASFREVLARVRATALGAYAHQDLPFERLVEELAPDRDASLTPLFQVMFAFQNVPNEPLELGPGLAASAISRESGDAKFDLTLYLSETRQGMALTWQYSTDLFEASTIERLAGHFGTLLESIVADPQRRIAELPLLSDAEQQQQLTEYNQTRSNRTKKSDGNSHRLFHHAFEQQAARAPDAPALVCGGVLLTYGELNARANQLTRYLRKNGVAQSTLVGIHLTRSAEMVVTILAVMKAGGAYVPLDPHYPAERLAFMLHDARVAVLITSAELQKSLPPHEATVVCLESEREVIGSQSKQNLESSESEIPASSLAYVIYTSGSAGAPKGVMITHANLGHYVAAMETALGITTADRWLHTASFSFSSSVRQFAVALGCGASVIIASPEQIHDPQSLFQLMRRDGATVLDIVPSYWRACDDALLRLDSTALETLLDNDLRLLLSASEPLPFDLPARWAGRLCPGAHMINMFGQTETTGIVTTYDIPDAQGETASIVPIGRPLADTQVYLLDASHQPVPIGVAGQIYVGGPGVGAGYLNQPELSAKRFMPNPFTSTPGATLYRTGDLARYRVDGTIEFLGREDGQIKLRGFRIEPGEIESVAKQHPAVRDCVVNVRSDSTGAGQLVAYVVPMGVLPGGQISSDSSFSVAHFQKFLARKLPKYSLPGAIVVLPALPQTPNGKVDRKSLPVPETARLEPEKAPALPGATTEDELAKIWSEILQVASVGVHDNFFDLGGDSILSIRMIARANQAGIGISARHIFQHQTIAELAQAALTAPRIFDKPQELPKPLASTAGVVDGIKRTEAEPEMRTTLESLRAYGREALEKAGLSPEGAAIVAEVQLEASLRGQPTHNMGAIPRYARRLASGATNPRPHFQIERETQSSALLDGDNGPGQWVATVAMELAIKKARTSGVGIVGARRSNHFGAAGHYAWLAAKQNLIGLCTTNGALWLAPTGGLTPTFGNNPLGVGIPAGQHHSVVLDVSMSVTAKGKIGLHLAEGKPLQTGWIFDRFGVPTADVAELAAGLGIPIGGHKGYGLALVMEVLAGVLTGAGFCSDHERERMRGSTLAPDFGHFFIAINPELFVPIEMFTTRVDQMLKQVKSGKRMEGVEEIFAPGEMEMKARERNLREGVPLLATTVRALREHGDAAGLKTEIVGVE